MLNLSSRNLSSRKIALAVAIFCLVIANISQARSGKIDACKLISASQASHILGSKIKARTIDTSAAGPNAASMCGYSSKHINNGFMLIAGHIKYANAANEVKAQQKLAASHTPPGITKPSFASVKGIGDAAYLYKTPGAFQLHVLAHGNSIVINRNVAANTKLISQAKQLARIALKQLKH
jgi:hypothetical protein